MAQIQSTTDKDRDTTLLVVTGTVTSEDVIRGLRDFYATTCTANALWDFSGSNLQDARLEQLAAVLAAAKAYGHLRQGGKTALVVPSDLGFGLARMYESMAELKNHPVEHGVFRSRTDALAWLENSRTPD